MTDYEKIISQWQESNEEATIVQLISVSGTTISLSIGEDEQPFKLEVQPDGSFEFSTNNRNLKGEWLEKVKTKRSKDLEEVLNHALEVFLEIMDAEDEAEEEEEDEEQQEEFDVTAPRQLKKSKEETSQKAYLEIGSAVATMRLIRDLKSLGDTKSLGFLAEPQVDTASGLENLYWWRIKLFDFDPTSDLAKDMAEYNRKHDENFVTLEMRFSKDYPYTPPFVRVVKPRFVFRTGHVTIGGSICMELLTNTGWVSTNDIESVLIQIRAELLSGGARLDTSNDRPYTDHEAWEAFTRVARSHSWNIDALESSKYNHI